MNREQLEAKLAVVEQAGACLRCGSHDGMDVCSELDCDSVWCRHCALVPCRCRNDE